METNTINQSDSALVTTRRNIIRELIDYRISIQWLKKRAYKIGEKGKEYNKLNLREISLIKSNIDDMDKACRNLWGLSHEACELEYEEGDPVDISDKFRMEIQKPLQLLDSMFEVLLCSKKFSKKAVYTLYSGIQCYADIKDVVKKINKKIDELTAANEADMNKEKAEE